MKIIAYYRVSTKRQGESGLGLEGQVATLTRFADIQDGKIIASYKEIESGKRDNRPELMKALAHAKRSHATLVVAKMDRLSRNATFLSAMLDSGVSFLACDNPHANELTVRILAAVAQEERRAISERTKTALQAAKARGVKLGSARPGHWTGREQIRLEAIAKGRVKAWESLRKNAIDAYADLIPDLVNLRDSGYSLGAIAAHLNDQGHTTRRGKAWNASQVMRVLRRA
jgi:DNA invertase Pin-like site-specific DNA recombinase